MVRLRQIPQLQPPDACTLAAFQPVVSVIVPARNEAHTIERCLDGLLAQAYPAFEIIVVDDGSTDATPAILARYADHNCKVRVLRGQPLRPGWTGKNQACQQAADAAQGDWLLLLDADTVPEPTLIATLVTHAYHQQLHMLTTFPFLELGSFWERAVLPPFRGMIYATFPFERVNAPDSRPDEVVGNGQCFFVQREAYRAVGGHAAVSGEVLEDVHLAQRLRAAGYRVGAATDRDHLRVRMYTNGREVLEGLTKNALAGYLSGGGRAFWVGARLFLLSLAPFWLLATGLWLLLTTGMAEAVVGWVLCCIGITTLLVALVLWRMLLSSLYSLPWYYAPLWPFGLACYGLILLRSLWQVRSGRGVNWKGRTYVGT
jgi:glycosyltransferase involved in cell wall biosynthesis